ncbi:hypothetical protein KC367_g4403 [Hortaea werneckii]|nr:hypothetical protein KC358_g5832 [Hortaea werneckii]OTA38882.1 hypothetical protein BTJ68_01387 [Hortaea werneckii EXF-2000]KAI6841309.1 hypothetical protein KC350_g5293 [Hortaea werneckii]KAI6928131.1 hypothetical protein KC341_g11721 [Hortaea werneckii]KAI6936890.1 hypothetical protein KC348_g5881 [Hortaea werneckii]
MIENDFNAGTAFWYSLRGFMRIVDPVMVASWFRPPVQAYREQIGVEPNDLELYNIRTDAWGLLTLAMLLVALADAVPLPPTLAGSSLGNSTAPTQYKKPYARAAVLITIFHHITTGIGAYQHWKLDSHHTVAMDIGVYGNVGLTVLGVAALVYGLADREEEAEGTKGRKKV